MRSIRRRVLFGGGLSVLLASAICIWATFTELSGAVIAAGQLVVDSNVKKVQHPTGGVVGELRVRDGTHVKAGEVVVRLDETQTRANLAVLTGALDELMAREARDEAERDGARSIAFPLQLLERHNDVQLAHLLDGERKLFETRTKSREGQKAQLKLRIEQLRNEIEGNKAQEEGKVRQIEWITKELQGVRDLWEKNLVPFLRVTSLERDAARISGEQGQTIAMMAQINGKIAETELQILQVDQDMRTEVGKDLADIRGKRSELAEKKIAAEDLLKRVDIRAPQDGVVHQMTVHTIGGVVTAGEPMMVIVPETDALMAEAKLQPQDIDQVRLGQKAVLRFSAFNQRTTPELSGLIDLISADVTQDQKTGTNYYTLRVKVAASELSKLPDMKLIAGMPVEVFIQTPPRTVLAYLVKPLHDQMMRAFREK